MRNKITSFIKPLLKSLLAIGLVLSLAFSHADGALAAPGGGRIGGGSFRAPSRTYSAPRTYAPPGGGYGYGYGGGYGFPFVFPFPFFVGGGGLFSILIFLAIAGFLVNTFRRFRGDDGMGGYEVADPTVSVARLQVGLLAEARELQADLNKLALKADTSSTAGLSAVLQETSLALLRHPEYWVYASASVQQARLQTAETEFNRMLLSERSKFSGETLSNVNSQLRQATESNALAVRGNDGSLVQQEPGEYIVVTLLVGAQGKLNLPAVNNSNDLRQALQQLGGIPGDRLLALEVLWTPQAEGDVLTSDDLLVQYPNLKMV
ncbi:DUF1517 domain-containing protein [Leptothermofonsia sichuanensis E412]|uniref:DUF1517 domain-containing protein n=1 Tax=Leptothermofonsia sichuanensis TaxID=2917832 RepID=UPI001CA771B5|nr:DUF1517 domain-containing protein [Leptothermofonsia sichuanensis]QZZ20952.1 DUF1517 domain-containing protein [Leptothermofonsia sichuanensis E412]